MRVGNTLLKATCFSCIALLWAAQTPAALYAADEHKKQAQNEPTNDANDAPDIRSLIEVLSQGTLYAREKAAESLGRIGDSNAVEPLMRALDDEDSSVAAAAAKALGEIGDPRAIDPLIKALTPGRNAVYEAAAEALGEIGGPRAVEGLIGVLRNKWWYERVCAIKGLRKIENAKAAEAIVRLLQDEHEFVRMEAAAVLNRLKWNPQTEDQKIALLIARGTWDELVGIGTPALPAIFRMLEDDLVHEDAAKTLDRLGWKPQTDAEKVTYLIAKRDEEELLKMGSRVTDSLVDKLRSEHEPIRLSAARTLGKIGDPKAVPALVRALDEESDWVNEAAADALDQLNWQPGLA